MSDWFEVNELTTKVWAIREPNHEEGVISYLVVGRDRAVLIDTGMGIDNMKAAVEGLTQHPVLVVNTHSHYDHVGDNYRFEQIAIHREEAKKIEKGISPEYLTDLVGPDTFLNSPPEGFSAGNYQIHPSQPTKILKGGEKLSLGDRTLEIIHTPGHSPGSICLLDHENGILFSGDTVYEGELYIQLPDSDFCAYFESLERLVRMMSSISVIFPSHGKSPLIPGFINNILSVFSDIDQGGIEYWYESSPWGRIRVYEAGGIQVFLKNDFNK